MTEAPAPARQHTRQSGLRSLGALLKATELDTRMLGMVGALLLIWIAFHILSGGLFLTPRNLWNSVGAIIVRRHYGDGHGSCYCDPQHRSVDRFDARLYRDGDGRHPDRPVTEAYRLRSTGDLASDAGSGLLLGVDPWRDPGICNRLSRHTFLHPHARRPAGLAGRGMVGNERSDGRAAGHALSD